MTRKVKHYQLISSTDREELNREIALAFSDGYELYGNPIVALYNPGFVIYCQAVVEYES